MSETWALDLGSTRVKAARISDQGRILAQAERPAPASRGAGRVRESAGDAWLEVAREVLAELGPPRPGQSLALASQRSSFLLCTADAGAPVTPLVSWQDRRAADWCAAHADLEPALFAASGLPLSPHYVGPKLACLFELDPALARRAGNGELKLCTLDSFLVLAWSGVHRLDETQAARTLLSDARRGQWNQSALELFGVDPALLPALGPSCGFDIELASGLVVRASLADQAASFLALAPPGFDAPVVTLGTGGFVLCSTGASFSPLRRYLAAPVLARAGERRFVREGTINGGGASIDRWASGPTELPSVDPAPEAFALPDENGVGAPHWRADRGTTLSRAAAELAPSDRRRVGLEGLVFRVAEIVEALEAPPTREALRLAGGLAREPFVSRALATVLDRPVELASEAESTLIGAASLLARDAPPKPSRGQIVNPDARARWLIEKRLRWQAWLERELA